MSNPETFDPPTAKDCLAISGGKETAGQNGTTSNRVGIEMAFAVADDVDLLFLQTELDVKMQRDVLQLLVGCGVEGSFSIDNNKICY